MTERRFRLLVVAEAGLALALGLIRLGQHSIWLDEAVSLSNAKLPWSQFVHNVTGREANMGLYYAILRVWRHASESEAGLRSLSVVAAVATVPFVVGVATRLVSRRVALLAGVLVVVNPLFVHYAHEARGYELCLLLASASTYLFVRGIERPDALTWLAWVVVSAAAGYTHYFGGLVVVAQLTSLALLPRAEIPWRPLVPSVAGFAVLSAPLLVFTGRGGSGGVDWIAGTSTGRAVLRVRSHLPRPVGAVVLVIVIVALTALVRRIRRDGRLQPSSAMWRVAVVACWLGVPVVLAALYSYFAKPVITGRYLIVVLPAVAILAAWLLDRIPNRRAAAVVVVVILLGLSASVGRWYKNAGPEDWRGTSAYIGSRAAAGDGILFYAPYVRLPFEYYLTDSIATRATAVYPAFPWRSHALDLDRRLAPDLASIVAAASGYQRLWLVSSHLDQQYSVLVHALEQTFRPAAPRYFAGITVTEYQRT